MTIEEIKGIKVNKFTALATLAIDSLGSVVFVRQLSERFGGIRITPREVFTSGMTINLLAKQLNSRLKIENPKYFLQYFEENENIVTSADIESNVNDEKDENKCSHTCRGTNFKYVLVAPSPEEQSFEECITCNIGNWLSSLI